MTKFDSHGAADGRNHPTDTHGLSDGLDDDDSLDFLRSLCEHNGVGFSDRLRDLAASDPRAFRSAVVRHLGQPVLGGALPRVDGPVVAGLRARAAAARGAAGGADAEAVTW